MVHWAPGGGLPVQAEGEEHQEHHDEGVRGVEIGEDQAHYGQAQHHVAEDEADR